MSVWFVSSSVPGIAEFLRHGCVAVNFWVRAPVVGLVAPDIRPLVTAGGGRVVQPGARTRMANQLAAFAAIPLGDHVMTFDRRDRSTLHVGEVTGPLCYQDPPAIPQHPHVLPVRWTGTIQREDLADGGVAVPRTPGITVARIYDVLGITPTPTRRPEMPRVRPQATRRPRSTSVDDFTWAPITGLHRYRLVQTFGRLGPPTNPYVVFMVNPGGNDLARIRRSTTCHRVRAWGLAHDFDGATYLNLFTRVTNDVAGLAAVDPDQLNGPLADDTIIEVLREVEGPVVAGWGNPSIDRATFASRVEQVRAMAGDRMRCLGLTGLDHPRHGRFWRPQDELIDLP